MFVVFGDVSFIFLPQKLGEHLRLFYSAPNSALVMDFFLEPSFPFLLARELMSLGILVNQLNMFKTRGCFALSCSGFWQLFPVLSSDRAHRVH